jgi:hypothetical protein
MPNDFSATFQNVERFLKNLHSDDQSEQDLLSRASSIGLDPWGKRYLINIGNMRNKDAIESGSVLVTWAISAGPNGRIETPDYVPSHLVPKDPPQLALPARGDDIGCVIMAHSLEQWERFALPQEAGLVPVVESHVGLGGCWPACGKLMSGLEMQGVSGKQRY